MRTLAEATSRCTRCRNVCCWATASNGSTRALTSAEEIGLSRYKLRLALGSNRWATAWFQSAAVARTPAGQLQPLSPNTLSQRARELIEIGSRMRADVDESDRGVPARRS